MQNQDMASRQSCRFWLWCHPSNLHRSKAALFAQLWATVALIGPLVVTRPSIAQVVQLPAFRQFSYVGGSMLPDAGAMNVAGNRYSIQSQSSTGGLLPSVARSGIIGQTSMVISAQIIDLDALDQALLISNAPVTSSVARSAQADTSQARSADQARDFLSNYASQSPVPARAGDYGSILQRMVDRSPAQPVEASLAAANIRYYLQKGREAEASQRLQAARVYYRLAQEAMTPEIHLRYQQVVDQRQQAAEGQRKDAADDKLQF